MTVPRLALLLMLADVMRPSASAMARCVYRAARSGLWVTRISVWPAAFSSESSAPISSPVAVSTAPVGSSASSTAGLFTSARAIATRCRCPPDSRARVGVAPVLDPQA